MCLHKILDNIFKDFSNGTTASQFGMLDKQTDQ